MLAVEPITMVGFQAIIWEMLVEQMEESRQLLQGNRRKVTVPVDELALNEVQSEERSYNRTVDHGELRRVRRNKPNEMIERNGCTYKDFMASDPPCFSETQH